MSEPKRIYGWINTQLSIARFYGGCTINGAFYAIRYDLEGQPLEEVLTLQRSKSKLKAAPRKRAEKTLDLFAQAQRRKQA